MCNGAEGIQHYYNTNSHTNIHFVGKPLVAFKPGVSDKLLFNKIIDRVINNLAHEIAKYKERSSLEGINILSFEYWSYYGWYDEMKLKK